MLVLLPFLVQLSPSALYVVHLCEWATYGLFVLEYTVRFFVADNKKEFIWENLIDTAVIILPVFSPIIPDARYLIGLRVISAIALMLDVGKDLHHLFRAKNVPYAMFCSLLTCVVCGVLAYNFEHAANGANITSPQDGVWWAFATLSTVGYGDKYPVTEIGRLLALPLMVLGPLFIGIMTAGLTATMMKPTEEELAEEHRADDERLAFVIDQKVIEHLKPINDKLDRALAILEAHGLPKPE